MKIIVADTVMKSARAIELALTAAKHTVEICDIADVVAFAQMEECSVIIVSLELPNMEVVKKLRLKSKAAIIVMCKNIRVQDTVLALASGADDCMSKPYHNDELNARVIAVARRTAGHPSSEIRVGRLSVLLEDRVACWDNIPIRISPKHFQMLELLMMKRGGIVTKRQFIGHVYQQRDEPGEKIIDVFICKMRKILNTHAVNAATYIETVWGQGYRIPLNAEELREKPEPRTLKYVQPYRTEAAT